MGIIMEGPSIDVIKLLEAGQTVQIKPQGYSMYPMLYPGRDSVIIEKADRNSLKRGDVVLYRRDSGILVLHRIWKIIDGGVYLVGDNQEVIEGPLRKNQIKGKMIAFIYKGKTIATGNPVYCLISRSWLLLRPYRGTVRKCARRIMRLLGKDA